MENPLHSTLIESGLLQWERASTTLDLLQAA